MAENHGGLEPPHSLGAQVREQMQQHVTRKPIETPRGQTAKTNRVKHA